MVALTFSQNNGVLRVYKIGLMAELIGMTQIENHMYNRSPPSLIARARDKINNMAIGTQQQTSVNTTAANLFAMVV